MPLWLVAELTYRCPLKCPWCSNPLNFDDLRAELSTEEWKRVLTEARALGALQLGFSGGEPLLRPDLEELVAFADGLGYYTNLITSGIGPSSGGLERLARLKEAGLKQVQLSLQSADAATTDRLVGLRSHDRKVEFAAELKRLGMPMVLNVPVCRQNIGQVEAIIAQAEALKIDFLELANVQYYSWALLNRSALMPSLAELQQAEAVVQQARARIGDKMPIYFVIPDYYNGRPKGCMKGWANVHLTIGADGVALPCQEARILPGLDFPNVRQHSLHWIWNDSPAFKAYRGDGWMKEPCRNCDEKERDYGGCRCQAFMLAGDATAADPTCSKSPHHHLVREALDLAAASPPDETLIMRERGALAGLRQS